MQRFFQTDDSVIPTILRITVGAVILAHGLQKVFGWFGGHGPLATIASFNQWFGLPPAVTVLVIVTESLGALCLIFGFLSRFTAGAIGMVMLGAIYLVVGKWGFFMNWYSQQRGEGFEFHLLVLGMVISLIIAGGGRWSIDRVIHRRLMKIESSAEPRPVKVST